MSIVLEVVSGPITGKKYQFSEPDVFIFGRSLDCHCSLPGEDITASRHHFLLEVCPPECKLKDLGSLNGTYINGIKYGGRRPDEKPDHEKAAKDSIPVHIKNGDRISVGHTTMQVNIKEEGIDKSKAVCVKCECSIPREKRDELAYIGGTYLCQKCRREAAPKEQPAARHQVISKRIEGAELLEDLVAAVYGQSSGKMPQISGYKFKRELGKGSFGKVYLVTRQSDGKELALKIMLARKKSVSEKDIKVFRREMENCTKLKHPNIVIFEEQGHEKGMFYFTMEYCANGNMRDLMRKRGGTISAEEGLPLMIQILEGLDYIHKQGYVHRDLKPENILLDNNCKIAKLADLGMAKNFQQAGLSGITDAGAAGGTYPYMPKEQLLDFKYTKPVSDIFAIGATFYNMLTNEFVYDFPNNENPFKIILEGKVIPLQKRKKVSKDIAAVIDKAIAPEAGNRYQTASEMKRALERMKH